MVRTNQGGSVLGFVVIGGVLALLLIGGVYFVKQQSTTSSDRGIAPVPTDSQPQEEEQRPSEEAAPQEEESASNEQQTAEEEQSAALPGGSTAPSTSTEQLPQTGPAESFVTVVMLGLLAGTAAAYVRSRRAVRSL